MSAEIQPFPYAARLVLSQFDHFKDKMRYFSWPGGGDTYMVRDKDTYFENKFNEPNAKQMFYTCI